MNFDVLRELNLPPVLMGDLKFLNFGVEDSVFSRLDFEADIFNELYAGSKWIRKFNDACIL